MLQYGFGMDKFFITMQYISNLLIALFFIHNVFVNIMPVLVSKNDSLKRTF